ncbi:MAG TPA: AAA family ATPase [Chloroflexota bacterium]
MIIATRDKGLRELPDTLWSTGTDSVIVSEWEEVRQTLERSPNCVAVIDGELPDAELARIRVELPGSHVRGVLWLAAAGTDPERSLLLAPDSLVFETVSKPISVDELKYRLMAMLVRVGAPAHVSAWRGKRPEADFDERAGKIVTVFSTKGGVGKSLIAVNTAVGLARLYREKVLLVDADLYYGDMLALLDASTQYTIADVCNRQMHDVESLLAATTSHSSGISILPRPPAFERVDLLNKQVLLDALRSYRRLFDHVIVNMSTPLDELNLSLLDLSDRTLLVLTPEIPSIQNTGRFIEIAEKLGLIEQTSVILNRADTGIDRQILEQRLACGIACSIRSSGRLLVQATNEGSSLFTRDAHMRHEITREMAAVVELVAGRRRPKRDFLTRISSLLRRAA